MTFFPVKVEPVKLILSTSGVSCKPRAQIIITTQGLENSRREKLLCKFGDFQAAVSGERRRLEDESIAGQQRRRDLSHRELNGKVPWNDSYHNAERGIACDYFAIFGVLENFLGHFQLCDLR